METQQFEIESNDALPPLVIVPRESKEISMAEYIAGTNLKFWDVRTAIKDRVNREAEVMYG